MTDGDKTAFRIYKEVLEGGTMLPINQHDGAVKRYMADRCLPSHYKSGMYLIPLTLVNEVTSYLESMREQRRSLVKQFMDSYEEAIERSKVRLAEDFDWKDYATPEAMEAAFSLEYQLVAFDVPKALKGMSNDVYEKEAAKAEQLLKEQAEKIQRALRVQFQEIVEAMQTALTPGPDGKKRKFDPATMERWKKFCQYFKDRNITDDAELAKLVAQSEAIISSTSADYIKASDMVREHVGGGVTRIADKIGQLTMSAKRSFSFEDDEL